MGRLIMSNCKTKAERQKDTINGYNQMIPKRPLNELSSMLMLSLIPQEMLIIGDV